MTPKQLIGESKTSVVKLIFQHSKKTKHNEIIILSWNSNGSIISHSYLSIEEALRDTESLLNKNIWGIDFRRKFSLFPNKEEFILLHFHNNIVIKAEYKTWHHK